MCQRPTKEYNFNFFLTKLRMHFNGKGQHKSTSNRLKCSASRENSIIPFQVEKEIRTHFLPTTSFRFVLPTSYKLLIHDDPIGNVSNGLVMFH